MERSIKEGSMDAYAPEIERQMKRLFDSLTEKDRRRYAAIEASKLGHGGIEYVARVIECDPKTIRQGQAELAAWLNSNLISSAAFAAAKANNFDKFLDERASTIHDHIKERAG